MLVGRSLLRRDHQDWDHVALGAQGLRQLIAVHIGHHDIQQKQVNVRVFKLSQRVHSVICRNRQVAVPFQHGTHQLSGVVVVLDDHDIVHGNASVRVLPQRVDPLLFTLYTIGMTCV